jgi:sec-independent protein translocase protein TatB
MFDISWSELMLIGVVALVVIGPKELPGVLRTLGQMMRKVRGMASEFQSQFQEAMREAEMADLKKEVDNLAHDFRSYDPLKEVRSDVENMGKDFESSLEQKPEVTSASQAEPANEVTPALPPVAEAVPAAETASLPDAVERLGDANAVASGVAPVAPDADAVEPAKPEPGGRAA